MTEPIATLQVNDALAALRAMLPGCVDSLVTDPPAGISFMGRGWDSDRGGSNQWITWLTDVLAECWRVLKPGAHGLVWSLPRTSHWTGQAIERAGFEIRDTIVHLFGQGMPKSHNTRKAIDKLGLDGAQWEGWGTALKPSAEHWWLIRKPLVERTIARNVLAYGTGAINVDACRIPTGDRLGGGAEQGLSAEGRHGGWSRPWMADEEARERAGARSRENVVRAQEKGRWPANVVLSHAPGCELVGAKTVRGSNPIGTRGRVYSDRVWCEGGGWKGRKPSSHTDKRGNEQVTDWRCVEGCPIVALDEQRGKAGGHAPVKGDEPSLREDRSVYSGPPVVKATPFHNDKGGASRFYYQAKATPAEKFGYCRTCDQIVPTRQRKEHNKEAAGHDKSSFVAHPTQKSLGLMRWLVRLVTPHGGLVLDPFCGTGSTGVAAVLEGFRFVGVDNEAEFIRIAVHRLRQALQVEGRQ